MNARLEPVLSLTLLDPADSLLLIDAAIDTGFSGYLALPPLVIVQLALPRLGPGTLTMADASSIPCTYYEARLEWEGAIRTVQTIELNGDPLLGIRLLLGHRLTIDAVLGGDVTIEPLP